MNTSIDIDSEPQVPQPNLKSCLECRQSIDQNAIKCKGCNAYQNWRRHLPFLAVLLSIFLGAMSVFSTSYPVAKELMSKNFDVEVNRIGVNAQYYTVMIQNTGKQPVAVKYINIFYGEKNDFLEIEGGDSVIPENKSRILRLHLPENFIRPTGTIDFSRREVLGEKIFQRCEIMVSIIGSNTEKFFEIKEKACWDISDFLTGIQSVG